MLKLPDVFRGCSNSKPVSSGGVGAGVVALVETRGIDSVDGSLCSFSCFFWRATLLFQHIQTRASKIKFRCQHVFSNIVTCLEFCAARNDFARKFKVRKLNFPCAVVGC